MKKIDKIFAVGFNHNSFKLNERSKLRIDQHFYQDFSAKCEEQKIESLVFLNTCNRTEFYGLGDHRKVENIIDSFFPKENIGEKMMKKSGNAAVQHLFKVASGLDSQLIGDLEILGQFKKAFQDSKKENRLSGYLERLSNTCIQSAKEIRNNTQLTSGTTSLSYASIQLLMENNIAPEAKILVIGTGKFGKSIAKNIHSYLPQNPLTLTNRDLSKSEALATEIGCDILPFEQLFEKLDEFDVLISAIDSPGFKVEKKHFTNGSNKILIDLSVPGFFDDKLKTEEGLQLFTVEEAAQIVNNSMSERKSSIPLAENILFKYIHEFLEWSELYEKSGSIKAWKETVQIIFEKCPHFEKMTDGEKNLEIKKSVRRFVHFIKQNERTEAGTESLLALYLQQEGQAYCNLLHAIPSSINLPTQTCQSY